MELPFKKVPLEYMPQTNGWAHQPSKCQLCKLSCCEQVSSSSRAASSLDWEQVSMLTSVVVSFNTIHRCIWHKVLFPYILLIIIKWFFKLQFWHIAPFKKNYYNYIEIASLLTDGLVCTEFIKRHQYQIESIQNHLKTPCSTKDFCSLKGNKKWLQWQFGVTASCCLV